MSLLRPVSLRRPLGSTAAVAAIALAALSACGGGSGGPPPVSTVTNAQVSAVKFGTTALITMSGTNLDSSGLGVTSDGCVNMTRLTSGTTVSTSTVAYYSCTVRALTGAVQISTNGVTLTSAPFTVPAPVVRMHLDNDGHGVLGDVDITLYADKAPATVANFLAYVNSGFYQGLIFHRYSPSFVVQGGGYGPSASTAGGQVLLSPKATNAPIAYESGGGKNLKWTVSMARQTGLNTATSQFFINLNDNANLDDPNNPYAVFGSISTASQAVVTAITTAPCVQDLNDLPPGDCLPYPNVVITSATQIQ